MGRSTKAGAVTPATRPSWTGDGRENRSLNEGRGRNPGDTPSAPAPAHDSRTLNEGRGRNPGDTRAHRERVVDLGGRSTKAGAVTPATRLICQDHRAGQGRSTKAGAVTPATPVRVVVQERALDRSTKAGAVTPATPQRRSGSSRSQPSAQRRPGP